ncbi:type II toxin-antitoxin system YoeB family toxin [Actinomyces glycerinitolerans]|uniref:Toxin yoeb n=1 Tax=Actinomyces glycerinitolerans TaxID=1892869 RepID=A0A1M4S2W7_9ACTO|nr:type II toxin-antitoxin system YoeB family toxin [Actinomyces glycerinitolerans]SHE26555.1 toxin yoeb [Actinomyces glycerinitolerans]
MAHHPDSFDDLLAGTGRWERLRADRSGQWSARLDKNWRLIVIDEGGSPVVARVTDIVDYH